MIKIHGLRQAAKETRYTATIGGMAGIKERATKEASMVYKFRVYGDVDGLANVHESITQDGDAVIHTVYADNLSDALAEHMAQIDDGIFENIRYTKDVYLDGDIERPIIATPNGWEV